MKLKESFITQEMDGEQIMVAAGGGFAGMVRSNATAAFIVVSVISQFSSISVIQFSTIGA